MKYTKIFVLILIVFVLIVVVITIKPSKENLNAVRSEPVPVQGSDQTVLNKTSCETAGGFWNSCGSACRTTPEVPCIEVCVEYCECQSSDQCPADLSCKDFVEGVGVCL